MKENRLEYTRLKDYLEHSLECFPSEEELKDIVDLAVKQYDFESNKGYRFERTETNERELAFYQQWLIENYPQPGLGHGQGILQDLFIEREPGDFFLPGNKWVEIINDRDRRIVATIIQWLGTNVGMSFLNEALERFGAYIAYKK